MEEFNLHAMFQQALATHRETGVITQANENWQWEYKDGQITILVHKADLASKLMGREVKEGHVLKCTMIIDDNTQPQNDEVDEVAVEKISTAYVAVIALGVGLLAGYGITRLMQRFF